MMRPAIAVLLALLSCAACKSKTSSEGVSGANASSTATPTAPPTNGNVPVCKDDANKSVFNGKVTRCAL